MERSIISVGPDLGPGQPSSAAVRAQVEHMLSSPELHASRRRRAFLQYIVDEALEGRGSGLRGYAIAIAVFGRDEAFEPQSDPVVRLEARRLRRDLDSYYLGAGRHDPIRITIPKGGYIPHFEWHNLVSPPAAASAERSPLSAPPVVVDLDSKTKRPAEAAAKVDSPTSGGRRPGAFVLACLAATAIVLIAAAVAPWLRSPSVPVYADRGLAIIVIPFDPLSNDPDDGFLSAGLTQDLITDLMRFEGFRLYSVPASFRQDPSVDAAQIGRELGVAYVVKGSIRSDSGSTRINAQLFDGASGQVLWSETYDRRLSPDSILGVEGELSGAIAAALGQSYGAVNGSASATLSTPVASNMTSYGCVLRAYQYRRTFDAALHAPVMACLQAAIRDDPGYAMAWAMLGWLHLDAARYGMVSADAAPHEMDEALAMASKAVDLAPNSVVALQALSAVQYHLGHFDESERIQRRALALNPNDPDTIAQFGWRLALRDRWDEAMPYVNRAIARTINPPGWYYDMITIRLYLDGKYREMLASAERSATGDPTGLSFLAIAQAATGDSAAARQTLAKLAEASPALASDPARIYGNFQPVADILDPMLEGLRKAGWAPPKPQGADRNAAAAAPEASTPAGALVTRPN